MECCVLVATSNLYITLDILSLRALEREEISLNLSESVNVSFRDNLNALVEFGFRSFFPNGTYISMNILQNPYTHAYSWYVSDIEN